MEQPLLIEYLSTYYMAKAKANIILHGQGLCNNIDLASYSDTKMNVVK